jgi:hypothetical protein
MIQVQKIEKQVKTDQVHTIVVFSPWSYTICQN